MTDIFLILLAVIVTAYVVGGAATYIVLRSKRADLKLAVIGAVVWPLVADLTVKLARGQEIEP